MQISSGLLGWKRLGVLFGVAGLIAAGCGGGTKAVVTTDASGGGGTTAAPDGSAGGAGAGGLAGGGGAVGGGGGAGGGGMAGSSGGQGGGSGMGVGGSGGAGGGAGASTTDGGAPDGGSASSGCAGKTYKLCEDFESGTVGMIPNGWTALQGYAPMRGGTVLANDAHHSGSMALKSDGMSTGLDRVKRALASLGPTTTKHWGRLFYKVGTPLPKPNSGVIHITMAALEGATNNDPENRVVDTVVAMNGTHQWLFNIPDDSCCAGSNYDWSFDTGWHCAEWNIDVATSSFRFFSDGQEVTALAFTGKTGAHMSQYMSIGLGTIYYQMPPAPIVMWFDDLAIDDNRVGCQ